MADLYGIPVPGPQLAMTSVITFFLGVLASKILPYEYRRFRESSKKREQEVETWYTTSKEMVSRVIYIGRRTTTLTDIDYDSMVEELDPLSERMLTHARTAPHSVQDDAVDALEAVAAFATSASMFAEMGENRSGFEYLQKVIAFSERMNTDEIELTEVNQLLDVFGDGEPHGPEISEDQVDDEQWEQVVEQLDDQHGKEGLQDIEDFFELPWDQIGETFDEEVWDKLIREVVRYYMQMLLVDLGEAMYEDLEKLQDEDL